MSNKINELNTMKEIGRPKILLMPSFLSKPWKKVNRIMEQIIVRHRAAITISISLTLDNNAVKLLGKANF